MDFISKFWKIIMTEIGTKIKLLIAYHPQIDGQMERTNQSLETYLRYYINYSQKNQVQLLLITQLILNNKTATLIGQSLFYANYE